VAGRQVGRKVRLVSIAKLAPRQTRNAGIAKQNVKKVGNSRQAEQALK
jgi:hypothetical protein